MALIDGLEPQKVMVSRDTTVSNERLNEERAKHAATAKHRQSVSPRREITVYESDGSSRTYFTGDKVWHGPDCIRSGVDWSAMVRKKDIIVQTESQHAIANDLPEARYVIAPDGKALCSSSGIKSPGEITTAADWARKPNPDRRDFINGRWLEPGELEPGSDGEEKLRELVKAGFIRERKLRARVKAAIKKATGQSSD